MKHLELHIIQSVPVACLNRDDLNSPKTAVFGGVQRARVSSQSWKRAIREMAKELSPEQFKGERTKLIHEPLIKEMKAVGLSDTDADAGSKKIIEALVKLDSKSKDKVRGSTLYFMSPLEIRTLAEAYAETTDVKKALKTINATSLKDAADISIFGRMVANDHSLTVEAASMFSHALSVHKSDNEIDFFTAVDDLQLKGEDAGSGMMGSLEFNSATFYRFAALNLNMLADEDHLKTLTQDERKNVVRTFVEATVKAIPGARKNTMNANTLPDYVFGVVREKGHPVQLVNAFESPIRSSGGYKEDAIQRLKSEYKKLEDTWEMKAISKSEIPQKKLSEFLAEVTKHAV